MGLVCIRISFESGIPSFDAIHAAYFKQTGLHIGLTASLHMRQLITDPEQILSILQQDAEQLKHLEQESKLVWNTARLTGDYETAAYYRDVKYNPVQNKLSRIGGLMFMIYGFYEIDFCIENNTIEISYPLGLGYGASSLTKTLIDLKGKFEDPRSSYPEHWTHLRKWKDYRFWNRPKK